MRISDWSSDLCSSDLIAVLARHPTGPGGTQIALHRIHHACIDLIVGEFPPVEPEIQFCLRVSYLLLCGGSALFGGINSVPHSGHRSPIHLAPDRKSVVSGQSV